MNEINKIGEKLSREEIKNQQLQMLIFFDNFCRKNNLKYSLAGGTLLGAVRHKGFIPWDDDIDVIVSRETFNILSDIFNMDNNHGDYVFESPTNSKTIYPFGKIFNTSTYTSCADTDEHKGIWIDIFPYDLINDDFLGKITILRQQLYRSCLLAKGYQKKVNSGLLKHVIKKILKCILLPVKSSYFVERMNKIACASNDFGGNKIGCIVWGYGRREIMPLTIFDDLIELEFENKKFFGFKEYNIYLSSLYGNYMKLPPEDKRRIHGFDAWYIKKGEN